MTVVHIVLEGEVGNAAPLWSGYLPIPETGAIVSVDEAPYEVGSHRYAVHTGAVWDTPVIVVVRRVP